MRAAPHGQIYCTPIPLSTSKRYTSQLSSKKQQINLIFLMASASLSSDNLDNGFQTTLTTYMYLLNQNGKSYVMSSSQTNPVSTKLSLNFMSLIF